jgi:hypothetical protein
MLRQSWDTVNRPQYRHFVWGEQQQRALDLVATGYSFADEEARSQSYRFLYIKGEPGSGKSEADKGEATREAFETTTPSAKKLSGPNAARRKAVLR